MTRLLGDRFRKEKYEIQKVKKKTNKPVIEKRRQDKINKCLVRLKSVVFRTPGNEGPMSRRLDKADIMGTSVGELVHVQTEKSQEEKKAPFPKCKRNLQDDITEMYKCVHGVDKVQSRRPAKFLRQMASTKLRNSPGTSGESRSHISDVCLITQNFQADYKPKIHFDSIVSSRNLDLTTEEGRSNSNLFLLSNSQVGKVFCGDSPFGTPLFSSTPNSSAIGRPLYSSTPMSTSTFSSNATSCSVRNRLFNDSDYTPVLTLPKNIEQTFTAVNSGNGSQELWRPWLL